MESGALAATADTTAGSDDAGRVTRLIDTDIHVLAEGGLAGVLPYMSDAWRRHFEFKGGGTTAAAQTLRFSHPSGAPLRTDAVGPSGNHPGTDVEFVITDCLDRWNIDAALINSLEPATAASALAGPDESVAICAAYNDYFMERWVQRDRRFNQAICVPSQDPLAAAREIDRLAGRPGVSAVFVPLINIAMGNRYFDPIYEAAQRHGLPIVSHPAGTEGIHMGAPSGAGGLPETFGERRVLYMQFAMASMTSLIFAGALSRFPELKVAFLEYGFTWTVPLLWRMDQTWRANRLDMPFLTELPSTYVSRHMSFATQPVDEPADHNELKRLVEMMDPNTLLFASDYPHWDNDVPTLALRSFPAEVRDKVAYANAEKLFPLQ